MIESCPLLTEIIKGAYTHDASDIHIQTDCPAFYRIHGEITKSEFVPAQGDMEDFLSVILKDPGAISTLYDKEERDLSYSIKLRDDLELRFRVNISMSRDGVYIVMRRLKTVNPDPFSLGVPKMLVDTVLSVPYGIIFIAGATGSGKSTTLASVISYLTEREAMNCVTIEDPIEYELLRGKGNMVQREVGRHTLSFAQALRAAMREDPDIILVGEVRDPETAIAAIQAARSGHIVFSTIHVSNVRQIPQRIANMFPTERQGWMLNEVVDVTVCCAVQALVPSPDGSKRHLATEITTLTSDASKELFRQNDFVAIKKEMETGVNGWTLNASLIKLYKEGKITKDALFGYSNDVSSLEAIFKGNGIKK
ncbi:MAG: Twitching mobility protein [Syntrophomonadaceae bacterium]|nr:Twitching mobility protein [Bacillota bacterium]